jgi:carboxyl-terminal processing protease
VQTALMLPDRVGYVSLVVFSEDAVAELRRAADSLRRAGAGALLVDLRGNPGGLLEQGVAATDLFLDQGLKIVEMRGRTRDANQTFVDQAPQRYAGLPIAVLVDSASASAAEILAGALQDHDRAVIVGTPTYGKGSAQSVFPLADGGAIKLTTALWYTPSGRSITRPHLLRDGGDEAEESSFVADTSRARLEFRTRGGRTVYGGGGVTPDVLVPADTPTADEQALERALGRRIPDFRQALAAYARSLRGRPDVASADFVVTPSMRSELYAALSSRGVELDRAIYDAAASFLSRVIGYEVARALFGRRAEFQRRLRADRGVAAASALVAGAPSQEEVFKRAAAWQRQHPAPPR